MNPIKVDRVKVIDDEQEFIYRIEQSGDYIAILPNGWVEVREWEAGLQTFFPPDKVIWAENGKDEEMGNE
jgi:hypothetical protein